MKVVRLVCTVLALSLVGGLTTGSSACDRDKATAAKSAKKTTTFVTASNGVLCTPEMMAACKASMAAGGPDLCVGKGAAAATASAPACCSSKGMKISAAAVPPEGDHCAGASASGVTADVRGASGAKTVDAVTAVNAPGANGTVYLVGAHGSCSAKTKASGASAGGECSAHGMASMAAVGGRDDCEACLDMVDCSGSLDAAGAHRQTVRLKNGIMYVYIADSPRSVSAVQAAVARRAEHMSRFASAGDKAHLCPECKAMRGAMASGKLTREVVNIEGGSLTLITSSDPAVVAKIHAMGADQKLAARIKS